MVETMVKMILFLIAICEATCTWSGQLPPKVHKNPTYSCKVFLGGVPWDITEGKYLLCSESITIVIMQNNVK